MSGTHRRIYGLTASAADRRKRHASSSWGAPARPLAATAAATRARSTSRGGGVGNGRGRGRSRGGGSGRGAGGGGSDAGVVDTRRRREGDEATARQAHQKDEQDLRKAKEAAEERHRQTLAFMARWVQVGRQ